MTMIEKMNQAEEYVLHTYNRFPVVFFFWKFLQIKELELQF